jgi:hypothetical protein
VIANAVADDPRFERRFGGTGPVLYRLEWDVKTYFVLNSALHDAAIAAWDVKRRCLCARPISLIRYMGRSRDRGLAPHRIDLYESFPVRAVARAAAIDGMVEGRPR